MTRHWNGDPQTWVEPAAKLDDDMDQDEVDYQMLCEARAEMKRDGL